MPPVFARLTCGSAARRIAAPPAEFSGPGTAIPTPAPPLDTTLPPTFLVVPCFNEAKRLDGRAFLQLAALARVELLFVDDGSTDTTAQVLQGICCASNGIAQTLTLSANVGKGEAVRQGLRTALARGAAVVGFVDADLSTPAGEIMRLVELLHAEPQVQVLLGSRIRLLGNSVERHPVRHYLGRAFATAASLVLALPVYDTQCGAKLFRCSPQLDAALAESFVSRWIFDVELLGRLVHGSPEVPGLPREAFREVPLLAWRDVAGSKLRTGHFLQAIGELAAIERRLRARRQGRTRG